MVYLVGSSLFTPITSLSFAELLGYQEGASAEAGRADYMLKIASDLVKRFSFFFPLFNSGN